MNSYVYKDVLYRLSIYFQFKDFEQFWNTMMPTFKYMPDKIFILRGLRRFMILEHKPMFDAMMEKHFVLK